MPLPTIASLWIGGDLSYLEQVCLKSFADHGHRTILYTYEGVSNAPEGVEVMDANLVFPSTNFVRHKESGSPAVHADAFRYRMIQLQNVVWVDTDVLCVRPWDFDTQYIFGWEKKNSLVCNAVFGLPRFSETLTRLNKFCLNEYPIPPWLGEKEQDELRSLADSGNPVHVSELKWGVWGPSAVTWFLKETGEIEHAQPVEAFYPVSYKFRRELLMAGPVVDKIITDGVYGIHLWNRRLSRRIVTNEGGIVPPASFLGRAISRHEIDMELAPIPDKPPPGYPTQKEIAERKAAKKAGVSKPPVSVPPAPAPASVDPATATYGNATFHIDRLKQSAPYQRAIEDMESRTETLFERLPDPPTPISNEKILVLTSMKNEAPFILEWIAYHKMIGATHFLVYTNDCTDNTNEILDRLAEMGLVTRLDNPWTPSSNNAPQHAALEDAMQQPVFKDADWVLTIDVDEFVNIHVGDGCFADLFAASNYPNVISFTWKFFGNIDVNAYEDRPISEQFTACAPEFIPKPRLGWGFKSMVHKSAPYTKIGVHRPLKISDEDKVDEVRWVNGSGRKMPDLLLTNNGWRSTKRSLGYQMATLNHYVLRSADSFLVKRDRGRVNHTEQDQGLAYWMRRNYTSETDARMLGRQQGLRKELDALMADSVLSDLHSEAVRWHHARIDALKASPEYKALYDQLTEKQWPDAIYLTKPEGESGEKDAPDVVIPEPELDLLPTAAAEAKIDRLTRMLAGQVRRDEGITPQGDVIGESGVATTSSVPQIKRIDIGSGEPQAPSWNGEPEPRFSEMRDAARQQGFFWEGEANAFYFEPVGKRLVVTFDNVHTARLQEQRWPWGHGQISRQLECSVLGIMSKDRSWFRDPFVHDGFDRLQESGWFDQFDQVLFYGASMGGYGALTFSRACPGANVLAIEPQTTLDRSILPDDDRWPWTKKLDWSGRYADAAEGTASARQIVVVSDPYFDMDRAHVERLSGDNIHHLRVPFFGHKSAPALVTLGNLKPLLSQMTHGTFDASQYYQLLRGRHDLARFQHGLITIARERGHLKLALKACEATLGKRSARNIRLIKEDIQAELAAKS